jgi:membrane associated rhomboid family serine protease
VIPIKDVIPPRRQPLVAIGIVVLGAVLFAIEWAAGIATADAMLGLMVNSACLWVFADNIEDRMGHARFAVWYLTCTAAALFARVAVVGGPLSPAILSSGGAAGILGAYLVLYPRGRILLFFPLPLTLVEVPAAMLVALFAALHVAAGAGTLMEIAAGFVIGAALCLALRRPIVW